MSILIKTMTNLPEHCYDCPCHDGESGYCQADKEHRYSDYRPFWCPLLQVSNEHQSERYKDCFQPKSNEKPCSLQQDHDEEVAKAFQLGLSFGFIDGLNANKTHESEVKKNDET